MVKKAVFLVIVVPIGLIEGLSLLIMPFAWGIGPPEIMVKLVRVGIEAGIAIWVYKKWIRSSGDGRADDVIDVSKDV